MEHTRPTGLSSSEVRERLERFGPNRLARTRRTAPLVIFARQFTGFLVVILIGAALVALVIGEGIDALAIGLVVLLNGILGFVQEWRAETALEALGRMIATFARVLRDGREQRIDAEGLVPGDLVIVEAGDRVPADLTVNHATGLRADESALTGESVPVSKAQGESVYMGTTITGGRAEGNVTATGNRTEFGRIAVLTESVGAKKTHLQIQLGKLARQMGLASVAIAVMVGGLGVAMGQAPSVMFMTALSLAVAIVPEGLPAVVTITLALGARAMARQKALARRLQAVETLGAASAICTDKTGTLTEDRMTATRVVMPDRRYEVTGTGYDPAGHIETEGRRVRAAEDPGLAALLETALICNHARLSPTEDHWEMVGEPTEGALVTLAYKGWAPVPVRDGGLAELPFSSERKRMSVLAMSEDGPTLHTKGAPEPVIARCSHQWAVDGTEPLTDEARASLLSIYDNLASDGLRVIALARSPLPTETLPKDEANLTFLGFVGLIDPPRPEVAPAMQTVRSAGIRVILITGDAPLTATAVAGQVGLPVSRVILGDQLAELGESDLDAALRQDVLFARTAPAQKLRIVTTLQAQGQIVAMTGDGVNDAPALKKADIGVAMGQRGTDVAREAADLVLLDDNFATIVRAIGEGRRQYENVRKFVRYLLASNAGEVVALVVNLVLGGPLVFLATQILWMNLVTDGITAVALGLEESTPDQMDRPPRDKAQPIVGRDGLFLIVGFGLYLGLASLWLYYRILPIDLDLARSAAFTAMVVFEISAVFAFRSLHLPCWRIGWASNPLLLAAIAVTFVAQLAAIYVPFMQVLLHTTGLTVNEWLLIAALALPLIVVPEVIKTVRMRQAARRAAPEGGSGTLGVR
ncbi:cation-translocating P-type ATPase [Tropicimonas isoalkanivorans]|uniref:Ca2+-transporting ATPase n=1 Tax=Tropicimonas isoalkanivorans TaxID=441112 RepID=A0A1I1Q2R0_9RHOB|nr:cation-transporting P-type ATPase [Tropicimonas isoalkanivorans]SFD13513.1 Ca2+-transporting ATPase [Tropicimonas isoalkanivorans]